MSNEHIDWQNNYIVEFCATYVELVLTRRQTVYLNKVFVEQYRHDTAQDYLTPSQK